MEIKSVSAVPIKRASGAAQRKKQRRGGHNVMWKRIQAGFFIAVTKFGANPALGSPATRWVVYGHLTEREGLAAFLYADIMRKFDRYHVVPQARFPRSPSFERTHGEDQELERRHANDTMAQYEASAKQAKKRYAKLIGVIRQYNGAKEYLDQLCLREEEPPANVRGDIALVLREIARTFNIGSRR